MSNEVEGVHYFKFVIIGSSGVGKTCILKRITSDKFTDTISTTGVETEFTTVDVDGKSVKLQLWDTAGQEKFRAISRAYFRNAEGVLLVFSVTDRQSFSDVNGWLNDARSLCAQDANIIIIGNKTDLAENRLISTSEAAQYAEERKVMYIETSAKTGENVKEALIRVVSEIVKRTDFGAAGENSAQLIVTEDKKKSCC